MGIKSRLESIELLLHRIDTAIVIRDPGTSRTAEVFEGLRRQILQSSKNRRAHAAHLVSLAQSVRRGASTELLGDRIDDFLKELGIEFTSDTSLSEAFEIEEGEGNHLECIEPAVIEILEDGQAVVISQGKARRIRDEEQPTSLLQSGSPTESVSSKEPVTATPNWASWNTFAIPALFVSNIVTLVLWLVL